MTLCKDQFRQLSAMLAQLVEKLICKQKVVCLILTLSLLKLLMYYDTACCLELIRIDIQYFSFERCVLHLNWL